MLKSNLKQDTRANSYSNFYPDFMFWLKRGDNYTVLFVDPKGTEYTSARRKVDGYEELFVERGKETVFKHNGFKVKVRLLLRTLDAAKAPEKYNSYWFDNIEKMMKEM